MSAENRKNECGRCRTTCTPIQTSESRYGRVTTGNANDAGIDYSGLCVYVEDTMDVLKRFKYEDDLAAVLRDFIETKSFKGESYELCSEYNQGIACTETLGIYCPAEDAIYYNIDRVAGWVARLYVTNMGTLMRDLAQELKGELTRDDKFELNLPVGLVKEVAAEAAREVAFTYLYSHERYHWANGPKGFPLDEEAMATAHGIYTVYSESLNPLNRFITMMSDPRPGELSMEFYIHYASPRIINYAPILLLEWYFRHLTLARLAYDHAQLKGYSGFTSYIKPIPSKPKLTTRYHGIYARFSFGNDLYVKLGGDYYRGAVDVLVKQFTPKFTGNNRERRGTIHEEFKHCQDCVDLVPGPWPVPIDSIINGQYLK